MRNILIFSIFVLFLLVINIEDAEAVACCEKLKGSSDYCTNVENINLCDTSGGFKSYQGQNCERVSSCQLGSCIYDGGGSCFNDQNRIMCEKNGGSWDARSSNEISICQEGCCFIGSNTFFSSEGECRVRSRDSGLPYDFDNRLNNDAECQAELDNRLGRETKGCCVVPDGLCSYGLQTECIDGDFRTGTACLDVNICKCENGYACLGGKKDVYETSSCGDEKIIEECNGITNKCGLVKSGTDKSSITLEKRGFYQWEIGLGDEHVPGATSDIKGVSCVPVSCVNGKQFILDDYQISLLNIDEENTQQIITINREMLGEINERKNGESWCIGPQNSDSPGSRHYVYRCVEGKVVPEACALSRNEEGVCAESRENSVSEARCVDNDWTKEEALNDPDDVLHPPAVQFYQGSDFGGLNLEESCGYCNEKDDWWNPLDQCKRNSCDALGDCKFSKDSFGIGGCLKGAIIAEAMWLTAGQIAAIGEGSGLFEGTSFANTGFSGFFDTGLFGDRFRTMNAQRITEEFASSPNYPLSLEDAKNARYLAENEWIPVINADRSSKILYNLNGEILEASNPSQLGVVDYAGKGYRIGTKYRLPGGAVSNLEQASNLKKAGDAARAVVVGQLVEEIWPQPELEESGERESVQNTN